MINHLFKMIWKRRKTNFLIMLEVFVAFIILFAVSSLSVYSYKNYVQPSGIKTDNVWAIYVNYNSFDDSLNKQNGTLIEQKLKGFKEIESYSFGSGVFPYGNTHNNRGFSRNGKDFMVATMDADETYPSVLGLELSEGTWFKNTDSIQLETPVIISQMLKEELFGNENAIGKLIDEKAEGKKEKVVGVISHFKHNSDFQSPENCIITPYHGTKSSFIVKTTPSVSADFEAQFAKSLRQLGKNWNIEILHMDDMKAGCNEIYVVPLTIGFIVCGFLIINVAFGLFGVLFQNINRRRGEIGLRRAMGATGRDISFQFVGEMAVLATFAIVLGVFFAVQFPILNVFDVATSVYIWGIISAVAAVYGLVLLCSWLPSRQAAAIHPAVALHEE